MRNIVSLGLFLIFVVFLVMNATSRPQYNWDMIPYIAAALNYEEENLNEVHHAAYKNVKDIIPADKYRLLTESSPYRRAMAERYDLFSQQLPGYKVKPLYVAGIYAFSKLGVNIVFSSILVSMLSAIGLAALILVWLRRYYSIGYACLLSVLLAIGAGIHTSSLFSTPDMLSALLIVLGVYLLLEQRRPTMGAIVLLISVFARIDNIILVTLIFCYMAFLAPRGDRLSLALFGIYGAGAAACYLAIGYFAHAHSWAFLFHHAFIELIIDPANTDYSVTPSVYLKALADQFMQIVVHPYFAQFSLFAGMSVITVMLHRTARKYSPLVAGLAMVVLLGIVLRYLAFPLLRERYMVGYYVILALLFLRQAAESMLTSDSGSPTSPGSNGRITGTSATNGGFS